MGSKQKQLLIRRKDDYERELQSRLSFLSGKGIEGPRAEKDTLVKGLKAKIKAMNKRMRLIAEDEKRIEGIAKAKAEKAAAPKTKPAAGKGAAPAKAAEEGAGKKAKAKKKPAAPKAPEA